jgi:hypothetical protein
MGFNLTYVFDLEIVHPILKTPQTIPLSEGHAILTHLNESKIKHPRQIKRLLRFNVATKYTALQDTLKLCSVYILFATCTVLAILQTVKRWWERCRPLSNTNCLF